jgi:lipopolysaccharide export LptBFGC system permease protein LptF
MAWLDFSRVPWDLMLAARAALVRAALRLGALLALIVLIFIQYGAPEGQLSSRQLASRAATLTLALMLTTSAVADYVYRRRLVRVAEERSRSGGEARAA